VLAVVITQGDPLPALLDRGGELVSIARVLVVFVALIEFAGLAFVGATGRG